jgi:alpha-tubulin suppressor-like RCC1 family protein
MTKRRRLASLGAGLLGLVLASCLNEDELLLVLFMAAGGAQTCAGLEDAALKCWGDNGAGQLGLGDTEDRGDDPGEMGDDLPAIDLGGGRFAVAAVAGLAHACALLDDDTVKCWGDNAFGQLGQGTTDDLGDDAGEMGGDLLAIDLGAGLTVVALAAGNNHSCALLNDDSVKCWGANGSGQLGQDATDNRGDGANEMGDNLPAIALGTGAVAIVAGGDHSCALLDDDTVKCWGENGSGQLGQGDTADRGGAPGDMAALTAIPLPMAAVAIAAGGDHTCAVLSNNTARCWGDNFFGQLGQGNQLDRGDDPGEVAALPAIDLGTGRTALTMAAGQSHSCAILDNLTVKCWGENGSGQLGQGDTDDRGDAGGEMGNNLPAVDLGVGNEILGIAAGQTHTCALRSDLTLRCWGGNGAGQLGQGDQLNLGDGPSEMGSNLTPVDVGTT